MKIFLYVIIGVAGGLLGGMGMGGGTLLIPLLTMFTGTEQHLAQAVNLIAFIPMSVVALIIHIKNKLVDFKYLLLTSLPAVVAGAIAAYLIKAVSGDLLKRLFGIFLAALGLCLLISVIVGFVKDKRRAREGEPATKNSEKNL